VTRFLALPAAALALDEIVIDEGQDFEAGWLDALQRWVHPAGRLWWLEDPLQQLYERQAPALDGWVGIRDDANYRTPRLILEAVNRLIAPERAITAAAPFEGEAVEFLDYDGAENLVAQTKQALTQALLAKFRKQDIAVVTFSGREKSRLLPFDQLGPYKLRAFTGRYDLLGEPQYTDGDVLIETVYRFKGQSAPCVVLTEVDFAAFDERARRKLFVGMTRASMKLYVVLSKRAAGALLAR
jgi:superfamily I DNA and RNA helicase